MKDHPESSIREAWILFMILGMCMINFPFIHIFDSDLPFFGIPKLVLYLMLGWPASIVVIWLFVWLLDHQSPDTDRDIDSSDS